MVYEFPPIHFESNLFFGELTTTNDIKKLIELYKGTLTKNELFKARNRVIKGLGEDPTTFGFKSDNVGQVTLGEFLKEHKVEI